MGIPLSGSANNKFALAVYADDGGTAVTENWVSAGFFSYVNHAAHSGGSSAFGLTGQFHIGAALTGAANFAGVFGVIECDSAETVSAHVYGGQFAVILSAGTYASGYKLSALSVTVNTAGATTNGITSGIFFANAATGMDAAFAFGNPGGNLTGTGADSVADASEDIMGHVLVYFNSTVGYINVYSDAT
jgi:hypothetical protein